MNAKLHHVAFAVENVERIAQAFSVLKEHFSIKIEDSYVNEEQKVRVLFVHFLGVTMEFIEATSNNSPLIPLVDHPIRSHIQKKGEGFHHLSLLVKDMQETKEFCRKKGFRFVYEEDRKGHEGVFVNFLNPKDTLGFLVEVMEGKNE